MPRIIILRLHPDKPATDAEFTAYLTNLGFEAFDASFGSPNSDGTLIIDPALTKIQQHGTTAVATAVLVLLAPPPKEYATPDLILHVKRNGKTIRKFAADYNVAVVEVPFIPPSITSLDPVAAYIALPNPALAPDADDAVVDLPEDGSPPNFTDLKNAVENVLSQDPNAPVDLATLTPAKCQHIAHEIAWNRHVDPLPFASNGALEAMYTAPVNQENSNARVQFEGALTQYRAARDAEAAVLARFIFTLSAAIACENKSKDAALAGLRFPIQPGVIQDGKIQEAEVVLEN